MNYLFHIVVSDYMR